MVLKPGQTTGLSLEEPVFSMSKDNSTICWGSTCVPVSVVKQTFEGYQAMSAPPTLALRQQMITIQAQLADEIKARRQCEGTLGPLQAKLHGEILTQQQTDIDAALKSAAPPGMHWDKAVQKYVVGPEKLPDLPAGRGRGGF
jgi:hypothetical protein